MITRFCPVCDAVPRRVLFSAGTWEVCRCADCGMVYLPSVPSYTEHVESFTWERTFRAERERRSRNPIYRFEARWLLPFRPARTDAKLHYVLRYRTSGALLDYGCGRGAFLQAASRYFQVTGIEISPTLAEAAAVNAPEATVVCAPATELKLDTGSFDIVTMFSYLEHEPQPLHALRLARELLTPGGILIIKTPNYTCLNRVIAGRHWCGYRFPDHCNYFTPRLLGRLVERAEMAVLPGRFADHLPTSDNMYLAAQRST